MPTIKVTGLRCARKDCIDFKGRKRRDGTVKATCFALNLPAELRVGDFRASGIWLARPIADGKTWAYETGEADCANYQTREA